MPLEPCSSDVKQILIELEHGAQIGQFLDCFGHDNSHLYGVSEKKDPWYAEPTDNLDIRINIQPIFWQQMTTDMEVTYAQLNYAMSVNFVGLATGCLLFIPFAKKYGRRPVYIVSTALMLATSFWASRMNSLTELYVTNLLQGLAGATNESIAEITVSHILGPMIQ